VWLLAIVYVIGTRLLKDVVMYSVCYFVCHFTWMSIIDVCRVIRVRLCVCYVSYSTRPGLLTCGKGWELKRLKVDKGCLIQAAYLW